MIEDCGLINPHDRGLWPDKPVYGTSFLRTKVAKNVELHSLKSAN